MDGRRSLFVRGGIVAWCFVGFVVAAGMIIAALAAVSSLVLPLLFAAVLAVLFRPVVVRLERLRLPTSLAAGLVVLGLIAVAIGVVWMTVAGILSETDRILDEIDQGLLDLELTPETVEDLRQALERMGPAVGLGFARLLFTGLSSVGGFAVGALLGSLIMYYLLKDGPELRRSLGDRLPEPHRDTYEAFVDETVFVLRRYWLGRTIVSLVVAVVVSLGGLIFGLPLVGTLFIITFIGGYIPYIGAFLGGAFAVLVALGTQGVVVALCMLAVVLIANLLVENLVDPVVTGRTLQIHPLVVLVVTTAGGIVGGLVGLIMAVPLTVIAVKAVGHLREVVDIDTSELRDTLRRSLADEAAGLAGSVRAGQAEDVLGDVGEDQFLADRGDAG